MNQRRYIMSKSNPKPSFSMSEWEEELTRICTIQFDYLTDSEAFDMDLRYTVAEDIFKDFISNLLASQREEVVEEIRKKLPKELGFDDYDKHMHIYIFEYRGNCGVCGLSWKKASQYEIYNN